MRYVHLFLACWLVFPSLAAEPPAHPPPLFRVVDLNHGEATQVQLAGGKRVHVKLIDVAEARDPIRSAVRLAQVTLEIDGEKLTVDSGNYRLPVKFGGVQIDCPVTKGYYENCDSFEDSWGLEKDARLRLWPVSSAWFEPGQFIYPARQRWFATQTQIGNEPSYVDGGDCPPRKIYYHSGNDIGGCEGSIDVVSACDGLVVSARGIAMEGYTNAPFYKPHGDYDYVYVLDQHGWFYRYAHLQTIDEAVQPGKRIKAGGRIGILGKEGSSGGWAHLHFDIKALQPSGKWGIQDAYPFLWEAYVREHKPEVIAVARPHHLAQVGGSVLLDGSRSWSSAAEIKAFEWSFTDGSKATGARIERRYERPGAYSEVLKVVDALGRAGYDIATVQVFGRGQTNNFPPTIHAAYSPTFDIRAGDPVTFKVRTFRTTFGRERWDFGDGSAVVEAQSDGNAEPLGKDGYAVTQHRYEKPGYYIARVERTNERGEAAVARLVIEVGKRPAADMARFAFNDTPARAADANSAGTSPAKNGGFFDMTQSSGAGDAIAGHYERYPKWWLSGLNLVDLDGDGQLDLFLAAHGAGRSLALLNDGHGHFRQADGSYPASEIHLAADINRDDKLDLQMTWQDGGGKWWLNESTPGRLSFRESNITAGQGRANTLIDLNRDRNVDWLHERPGVAFEFGDGKGNFKPGGFLEVAPTRNEINMHSADFNSDGFIDLAVHWGRYDYERGKSRVYLNDGKMNFADATEAAGLHEDGLAIKGVGDMNQDGCLDLIVLEGGRPELYLNDGQGKFTRKAGAFAGMEVASKPRYVSWGLAVVTDFDNDGAADILWNGRNFLWLLRGTGDGNFTYMNKGWNVEDKSAATVDDGLCFGDIDGDGALDIIGYTGSLGGQRLVKVYRNELPAQNWLRVRFAGADGNRGAAGAKIRLTERSQPEKLLWFEQVAILDSQSAHSYYSLAPTERHFGLGRHGEADVRVEFYPSGKIVKREVKANSTILISETE